MARSASVVAARSTSPTRRSSSSASGAPTTSTIRAASTSSRSPCGAPSADGPADRWADRRWPVTGLTGAGSDQGRPGPGRDATPSNRPAEAVQLLGATPAATRCPTGGAVSDNPDRRPGPDAPGKPPTLFTSRRHSGTFHRRGTEDLAAPRAVPSVSLAASLRCLQSTLRLPFGSPLGPPCGFPRVCGGSWQPELSPACAPRHARSRAVAKSRCSPHKILGPSPSGRPVVPSRRLPSPAHPQPVR